MASLHPGNDSTRGLNGVEEDVFELGDLERARKQCFLYMYTKKHFLEPPSPPENPSFALAGFYCFSLTLYLGGISEGVREGRVCGDLLSVSARILASTHRLWRQIRQKGI